MQVIRHLNHALPPCSVAIGNFDGLHLGHKAVLAQMKALAAQHQLSPTVLTFTPHPRRFFAPHLPPFELKPLSIKLRRLREEGVARVVIPQFDAGFAALTPQQFLKDILGHALNAKAVVTGDNFAFGAKRAGNATLLQDWGKTHGIVIETVPPLTLADGSVCSSSAIRHCLEQGDVARASQLMGRYYSISGRIVRGDGRGRGLGFPTANVRFTAAIKLPAYGVYAVRAVIDGTTHEAVANLGIRPTIGTHVAPSLEVHLFDYMGDLYGKRLGVQFVGHIRPEQKFDSLPALVNQMHRDCITAQAMLKAAS